MASLVHPYINQAGSTSSSVQQCSDAGFDDSDGFIQEDDSVPASIGQSDEDSDDALEAIIQQELAKFQQQQADRYAVLLAEGQAVLPLPSPAPDQQQLRALQRQQESLAGADSFEDAERIEYVPSTCSTLDAEQLHQHSCVLESCSCERLQQHEALQLHTDGMLADAACLDEPSQLSAASLAADPSAEAEAAPAAVLAGSDSTLDGAAAALTVGSPAVESSEQESLPGDTQHEAAQRDRAEQASAAGCAEACLVEAAVACADDDAHGAQPPLQSDGMQLLLVQDPQPQQLLPSQLEQQQQQEDTPAQLVQALELQLPEGRCASNGGHNCCADRAALPLEGSAVAVSAAECHQQETPALPTLKASMEAAAVAALPLWQDDAGDVSPWERCLEGERGPNQQPACSSHSQGQQHGRAATFSLKQQQQEQQHCSLLSSAKSPQGLALGPQHQHQHKQHQHAVGANRGLQQHCSTSQGRPSSAPAGSRRSRSSSAANGQTAVAYQSLQYCKQAVALGIVAESSQEDGVSARLSEHQQRRPCSQRPASSNSRPRSSCTAALAGWRGGTAHLREQQDQQALLLQMQQLRLSRPCSADPWRARDRHTQRPLQHSLLQQQQQQQQQSQGQGQSRAMQWDDSPIPNTPKWVPIAQAAACAPGCSAPACAGPAAAAAGGGGGAWGPMDSLSFSSSSSRRAAHVLCAGRPQTAGPVMVHSACWHGAFQSPSEQKVQQAAGSMSARSNSSSPRGRQAGMYASASAAGASVQQGSGCRTHRAVPSSLGAAHAHAHAHAAATVVASQQHCSTHSSGGSSVSAYLLDVLQQIKQANSCCKALGLGSHYKLAKGSSKRDKWQLEQIEVELWLLVTSSTATHQAAQQQQQQKQQQYQMQQDCGDDERHACSCGGELQPGIAAADVCPSEWHLKRKLSLQQFTVHLNRLRGCTAAGAGCGSPAHGRSAQRLSTTGATPAFGRFGNVVAASAVPSLAARVAVSPDRAQSRFGGGSRSSKASSHGIRPGGSSNGQGSQLLLLSPRSGSGSNTHSAVQPACFV